MQFLLCSVLSLMHEEKILCTPSLPSILLHYRKHGTHHGGRAANSGNIFQFLPTFNEMSLTSVNFEDKEQTNAICIRNHMHCFQSSFTGFYTEHNYSYAAQKINLQQHIIA